MISDYALVVTCERLADDEEKSRARLLDRLRRLRPEKDVDRVELFIPHPDYGDVPFFKDGMPPALLVDFFAKSLEPLRRLATDASFRAIFASDNVVSPCSAGYFRIVSQPVGGDAFALERTAQTSFVVRYYPPVADAKHFVTHYVTNHLPILARLPGVRNVLCYLPIDEAVPGCAHDPIVIRNEVVFDTVASLVDSLRSTVLTELRADSKTFPPFGCSTHHAMLRTLLNDGG